MNPASFNLTSSDCQQWAWLYPFQGVLYYDHAWLLDYLQPLGQWLPFDPADESAYNEVIQEAQELGFLYPIPGQYALMQINTAFLTVLRQKIAPSYNPDFFASLERSFLEHYRNICTEIRRLQLQTDYLEQNPIEELLNLEWPNIYHALQLSLQGAQDRAIISTVLRAFFKSQSWLQRWIPLAQTILSIVPATKLIERISCLDDLGTTHLDLHQPELARPYAQRALDCYSKIQNEAEAARQLLLMAAIYLELDRLDEAQAACTQAGTVFTALEDEQELQHLNLLQNEISHLRAKASNIS